jgi:hypothetical protein
VPREPPTFKIGNPKAGGDTSTIKVVAFASQLFGVAVTAATKSQVKAAAQENNFFGSSSSHPMSLFGSSSMVGGGGNAMTKALRCFRFPAALCALHGPAGG